MGSLLIRCQRVRIVAVQQFRFCSSLQGMNLLIGCAPWIMVPGKESQWHILLKILLDEVHICGHNPSAGLLEVHLHDRQTWRVTWHQPQHDTLGNLELVALPRLPIVRKVQVMWQVDSSVIACRHAKEGILELELVDHDGDVEVLEQREAASMVHMQVSHDDHLKVFEFEAAFVNLFLQILIGI